MEARGRRIGSGEVPKGSQILFSKALRPSALGFCHLLPATYSGATFLSFHVGAYWMEIIIHPPSNPPLMGTFGCLRCVACRVLVDVCMYVCMYTYTCKYDSERKNNKKRVQKQFQHPACLFTCIVSCLLVCDHHHPFHPSIFRSSVLVLFALQAKMHMTHFVVSRARQPWKNFTFARSSPCLILVGLSYAC